MTQAAAAPNQATAAPALASADLHDVSVFDEGIPHSAFAEMRAADGLSWTPDSDEHGRGFWSVTRHAELVEVSRNTEVFSSEVGHIQIYDIDQDALPARASMIDLDPPVHTRLRRLVSSAFTPRHVQSYEAAIRDRVTNCLDQLVAQGGGDWVSTVAAPIPIGVICDLMGVPEADHDFMIELSDYLVAGTSNEPLEPTAYGNTTDLRLLPFNSPAAHGMSEYARALGEQRRAEPADDLITRLIQAEVDGERLTDDEFTNFFRLMIFAGNETTRSSMAHLALHLQQFASEFERVHNNPELLGPVADEIIRYSSAILYFRRTVTQPTQLGGTDLTTGDKVVMWYAGANFDDTVFEDPLEFQADRAQVPAHVAFGGGGAHFCLGASLARLEISILVEEILKRDLRFDVGEPEFVPSNFVNGIEQLPVTVL